ncbi:hypothetical protein J3R82DRAFT_7758 [Butyriboletus roseoflavus]|nr:hypothetical protein J3R82DRAFT_7758 [Butyriboletus roseoflavus]
MDTAIHIPKPNDKAILFLTFKSTSFSKAVVHMHHTIITACSAKGQSYGLTSQSKIINYEFL